MQIHIGLKRSAIGFISLLFVGAVISVLSSSAAHTELAPDVQAKVDSYKKN